MGNGKNIMGFVLRVERSSIHDGSGLRTVLFMKGCPLRCAWCSTPESQRMLPERSITRSKCTLCGQCVKVCPQNALSIKDGDVWLAKDLCQGCFKCASACPNGAVATYGKCMSAYDVGRELSKDGIFFFHSGGGVTISGGEPFAQPEFLLAILRECRAHGLDCALESSFFAEWPVIEQALPYLDLIHADIKHMDSEKHLALTGVVNELILENIMRADTSEHNFDLVIRTPIIPGINDDDADIIKLAEFVNQLQKVSCMEFLAYHKLGTETYTKLGRPYMLRDIETPLAGYMRRKAALFLNHSIVPVKINGVAFTN